MQSSSDGNAKLAYDMPSLTLKLHTVQNQVLMQQVLNSDYEHRLHNLETNLEKANKRINELEKQLVEEVGRAQDLANQALEKIESKESSKSDNIVNGLSKK